MANLPTIFANANDTHSDETWWSMNQDFILGRLSEIMEWDTDRSRQEFDWLRLMSRMKYDGYQDFLAGMRFIESLADWLFTVYFCAGRNADPAIAPALHRGVGSRRDGYLPGEPAL